MFLPPVIQHLLSPSSVPTEMPSLSVNANSADDTSMNLTVGMSAAAGFIFLGIFDFMSDIVIFLSTNHAFACSCDSCRRVFLCQERKKEACGRLCDI